MTYDDYYKIKFSNIEEKTFSLLRTKRGMYINSNGSKFPVNYACVHHLKDWINHPDDVVFMYGYEPVFKIYSLTLSLEGSVLTVAQKYVKNDIVLNKEDFLKLKEWLNYE